MLFNFGKCKCLHTGHGNEDAQYTMGGTVLNTTIKEKDLGLTIRQRIINWRGRVASRISRVGKNSLYKPRVTDDILGTCSV